MSSIDEILAFNKEFVQREGHVQHITNKFPNKKLAILTCMDVRLIVLIDEALGLANGDANIITNAGAVIRDPYGSAVRSLLVSVLELGAEEIMVIAHTDCGFLKTTPESMQSALSKAGITGISNEVLDPWMVGISGLEETVLENMRILREHELMPDYVSIRGFIIDSHTGELTEVAP